MKIQGKHYKSVSFAVADGVLSILDQTRLPFSVQWLAIKTLAEVCHAISTMQVRGAPAIGAVAAYGMVFAVKENIPLDEAAQRLKATRPTAVNLAWAVERMFQSLQNLQADIGADRYALACAEAELICQEDIAACSAIGDYGLVIIESMLARKQSNTINILTHCNAGWLATVDWGTALAPIYKAHEKGIDVHVWVDETRPRNQGALLTSFELQEQGVKHTLICDNSGGHLMQQGLVDMCIVGSDRTAANGDVCNKIGTYLKALAAADNAIPFYVALPTSTIDLALSSGKQIPIEERHHDEVLSVNGINRQNQPASIQVCRDNVMAANPAFDVTPAKLVTGLITECGVFSTTADSLQELRKKIEGER